jgi:hypothetical protein
MAVDARSWMNCDNSYSELNLFLNSEKRACQCDERAIPYPRDAIDPRISAPADSGSSCLCLWNKNDWFWLRLTGFGQDRFEFRL